ncbi:MAG: amino-acid N-acetyltransferase [Treponema sp.]|jgi:amino-acid N-acetyltransferase|nr:amino-acid N-acetyltransferase [Treponema sp.]
MSNNLSQVELIRETFHYQSRYKGSTLVFKIDFPVTEDPGFPCLMKDLALLAQTGFKIVIVPGAKESIDAVLQQHDITSAYGVSGKAGEPARITEAQAIPFVEMAAFHVATRFMTCLSGSRVDAVVGNFVRARGLGIINGVDMGHTGTVDKIYAESISRVLNLGMVPILPCIGWSPAGKPYNVPSDEIALAVSAALGAVKLFIVSLHGGLKKGGFALSETIETRDDGSLLRLTLQEAEAIAASFAAQNSGAMPQSLRELRLALKASRAGVDRVHIIDGREEGAVLKELFSNLGAGTMVYTDEYESIRSFHSRDLPDILRLMEPLMQNGILIRRTPEQIQEKKNDFVVFEIDGSIHACGALHDWAEGQGEIAAVAADPLYAGMNLGRRIVGYLIEKARKSNFRRVFALTTHSQDWFESLGFRETTVDSLPEQKRRLYDQTRKSKVFALEL